MEKGTRNMASGALLGSARCCSSPGTTHLVTQSCKVPLKALMLALQGLDTGQIMAIVVCVQSLILLFNPLFCLVRVSVDNRLIFTLKNPERT